MNQYRLYWIFSVGVLVFLLHKLLCVWNKGLSNFFDALFLIWRCYIHFEHYVRTPWSDDLLIWYFWRILNEWPCVFARFLCCLLFSVDFKVACFSFVDKFMSEQCVCFFSSSLDIFGLYFGRSQTTKCGLYSKSHIWWSMFHLGCWIYMCRILYMLYC